MFTTPDLLLQSLRWRYATKQFDPARIIPTATWAALEQALVLAPSSFGLQPWKFLVIENPALRSQLLPESWNQKPITEASHLVVLTARTDLDSNDIDVWMDCLATAQGTTAEALAGYRGMIEGTARSLSVEDRQQWNVRQVYLALGQLMTAAALLGIDTCPMEGINPAAYDQVLGLAETGYSTVVACTLGYRAETDKYATQPKARFAASQVIEHRR